MAGFALPGLPAILDPVGRVSASATRHFMPHARPYSPSPAAY
ncbi:hypothetical protein ACVXG7_31470 [Enterobacter hormaechei]